MLYRNRWNRQIYSCINWARHHLDKFVRNIRHQNNDNNLTKQERDAVIFLQRKKDIIIIIKEVGKGVLITIMNRTNDIGEAENQLNSQDFYEKLTEDPIKRFESELYALIINLDQESATIY